MTRRDELLGSIAQVIEGLTNGQLDWVNQVVVQFGKWHEFTRLKSSDIVSEGTLQDFGDALRVHHCFSSEAFSKDKFEYVLERVSNLNGLNAGLAPKGNPGHDIVIEGVKFSLKTEAAKTVKLGSLHISKFMELGRGEWSDNEDDLIGLRQRFFDHLCQYSRILTLRKLPTKLGSWSYELVEIPKDLLLEAKAGKLEMRFNSKQMPKPGYCYVKGADSEDKFQLYFDGGTERKLQIKKLSKQYCVVHATWNFDTA